MHQATFKMCATMSRRERLLETFAWDCYATRSTTPHAPSCYRSTSRSRSGSTDSDGVGPHLACCVFAAFGKPILAMLLRCYKENVRRTSMHLASHFWEGLTFAWGSMHSESQACFVSPSFLAILLQRKHRRICSPMQQQIVVAKHTMVNVR